MGVWKLGGWWGEGVGEDGVGVEVGMVKWLEGKGGNGRGGRGGMDVEKRAAGGRREEGEVGEEPGKGEGAGREAGGGGGLGRRLEYWKRLLVVGRENWGRGGWRGEVQWGGELVVPAVPQAGLQGEWGELVEPECCQAGLGLCQAWKILWEGKCCLGCLADGLALWGET